MTGKLTPVSISDDNDGPGRGNGSGLTKTVSYLVGPAGETKDRHEKFGFDQKRIYKIAAMTIKFITIKISVDAIARKKEFASFFPF